MFNYQRWQSGDTLQIEKKFYVHLLIEKNNETYEGPATWSCCAILPYYISLSLKLLNIKKKKIMNELAKIANLCLSVDFKTKPVI